MTTLQRRLGQMFKAPAPRKPDQFRLEREGAKRMAADCGAVIEPLGKDGGMNVWPPKGLEGDPFDGDHYCADWQEAYIMVRTYQGRVRQAANAAAKTAKNLNTEDKQ